MAGCWHAGGELFSFFLFLCLSYAGRFRAEGFLGLFRWDFFGSNGFVLISLSLIIGFDFFMRDLLELVDLNIKHE